MPTTYPYPFDNAGTLPSNKIPDEQHVLSFYSNDTKTIIPVNAPFYRKSLKVLHVPSGEYLTEGLDFYLGHIFESAQSDQRYSVYGSISFNEIEMVGNVIIEYQTLGGPYTIPFSEILTYLNKPFERPQSRTWKEVMKYPRDIVPMDPIGSLPEAISRDPVTRALNRIQLKLREYYDDMQDKLDDIFVELERVEGEAIDWGFPTHDHENGLAHSLTPQQLGAVPIKGSASDTLKAYNMSLAQLVAYIETININQDKLDEYLPLTGGLMRGRIMINKTNAIIINKNSTTSIDLRDGSVRISTKGDLNVKANSDKNGDVTALLRAGLNRLGVASSDATVDDNTLIYNGFMVLHAGNIAKYIPSLKESQLAVAVRQTEYVTLQGSGRGNGAVPLSGVVTFPKGTVSRNGVVILAHEPTANSDRVVPSTKAIYSIKVTADGLLDGDVTINGKPLTGDIIITDIDLGLGRVDNTAPENKPSSTAFLAELAKKADADHTHDWSEFDGWTYAGIDVYGFFRLSSDITSNSTDHAATPDAAYKLDNVIKVIESEAAKYIPANALDVTAYGGTSGLPISVSGSFVNNGYPAETMGKTAMIVEGGYLKFLRNGGSYGEVYAPYYSYCTLDGTTMGDVVNTTVKYEPSFMVGNRTVRTILTSAQDYMLAVTTDNDDYKLMLIKMNGKIEASLHTGQLLDLGYSKSTPEYSIFAVNGYIYIVYFDEFRQQYLRMYRIAENELGKHAIMTPEIIQTSTDHIGGRAEHAERSRVYDYNMLSPSEYSFIRVLPGHSYNLYRVTYHTGTARSIRVIDGKMYLYMAFEGHHSIPGVYGLYFHTSITLEFNPANNQFTLLGGWPSAIDKIPSYDGSATSYVTYGSPDRLTTRNKIGFGLRSHHRRVQNYNVGKYELEMDGYQEYDPSIGIDSYDADPMERIDSRTRGDGLYIGKGLAVSAGGPILQKAIGTAIAYMPLNGTGPEVLCLVGSSAGRAEWWAMEYNETDAKQMIDSGVYPYNKAWVITYTDYVAATSGWINQTTGEKLSVFRDNRTTCALTGMTLDDAAITYPTTGTAIDVAHGAIVKRRSLVILEDIDGASAKWNAIVVLSHGGYYGAGQYRSELFTYRAKVSRSGTTYTVTAVEFLPGATAPDVVRNYHAPGLYDLYDWVSNVTGRGTSEMMMTIPGERFHSTHGNLTYCFPYDANGAGAVSAKRRDHNNTVTPAMPMIFGTYFVRAVADETYTALISDAWSYPSLATVHSSRAILLTAVSDNWTVYFTAPQPYYTANTEYVLEPDSFDLKAMFPSNHANKIFYLYATVINNVAVYQVKETMEEDYSVTSYIGFVSTNSLGIQDLDVRPLLRLGRVQELVDHINNPIAHTGSALGGGAIGLDKVLNMPIDHEFIPHVEPTELRYISEAAVLDYKVELQDRRTTKQGHFAFASNRLDIMAGNREYPTAHKAISNVSKFRLGGQLHKFKYHPMAPDSVGTSSWEASVEIEGQGSIVDQPQAEGIWFRDGGT